MAASGSKPLNPLRLDVAALADRAQTLQGRAPLSSLLRLAEEGGRALDATGREGAGVEAGVDSRVGAGATDDAVLDWTAHAERRPVRGGQPELWLHLSVRAPVMRTCQRCLQPVMLQLDAQRSFLFAPNEAQAEAWDAERDDADVLVLTRSLNLMELAEDELLLALPLVPRHEACPQPLPAPWLEAPAAEDDPSLGVEMSPEEPKKDNPFAILAQLKRGKG